MPFLAQAIILAMYSHGITPIIISEALNQGSDDTGTILKSWPISPAMQFPLQPAPACREVCVKAVL